MPRNEIWRHADIFWDHFSVKFTTQASDVLGLGLGLGRMAKSPNLGFGTQSDVDLAGPYLGLSFLNTAERKETK